MKPVGDVIENGDLTLTLSFFEGTSFVIDDSIITRFVVKPPK